MRALGTVPTLGHMDVKTETSRSLIELTVDVETREHVVTLNDLQWKLYYFPLHSLDQLISTCEILITQIAH